MSKRKILICVLAISASVLFMSSCKDEEPSPVQHVLYALGGSENTAAVFMINSETDMGYAQTRPDLVYQNHVFAYITDGTDFIAPSAIKCNGIGMESMLADDPAGQYQFSNLTEYLSNFNLQIEGYLGNSYANNSPNLPEISIPNLNVGDTLQTGNGLTLNYSGATGMDNHLEVWLALNEPDNGENNASHQLMQVMNDNGTVTIPASELANFPSGYYHIALIHKKIVTDNFHANDKDYKIIRNYTSSYRNYIYLASTPSN